MCSTISADGDRLVLVRLGNNERRRTNICLRYLIFRFVHTSADHREKAIFKLTPHFPFFS